MWKAAAPLAMTEKERSRLEGWLRAKTSSRRMAFRARICLLAARGLSNCAIAKRLDTSRPTVLLWRRRFEELGCSGLTKDAPHGPSPRRIGRDKIRAIVKATLHEKPLDGAQWTTRTMAKAQGVSRSTVARIWKAHGLRPWRIRTIKHPGDSRLVDRLNDDAERDVDSPDKVLVLCAADLVGVVDGYIRADSKPVRASDAAAKIDRFANSVEHCKAIIETIHRVVRSLAFAEQRDHTFSEREAQNDSEAHTLGTSRSRRGKEVAMSWMEKLRTHFAAAAFAEEGEYETARRMAGLPAAAAEQSVSVLPGFTTAFVAAAFAEENCPEIALEILSGDTRKNSFLDVVGLKGVRIYYGTVPLRESFAEAIGLTGLPFKVMTVRL